MSRLVRLLLVTLSALVFTTAANAACFADYKAKQTDPLRLHYGVIQLSDAECQAPSDAVSRRIGADGWELLTIMEVFDRAGAEGRKSDAGAYYLRY